MALLSSQQENKKGGEIALPALGSYCRLSAIDRQLFLVHPAAHAASGRSAVAAAALFFLLRVFADQRLGGEHQ